MIFANTQVMIYRISGMQTNNNIYFNFLKFIILKHVK